MNRPCSYRSRLGLATTALLLGLLVAFPEPTAAQLQTALFEPTAEPITMTLDEAIQVALINNYTLRNNQLDIEDAQAQVRGAWGLALPRVDLSSSYTRNLKSANPFAGSAAGSLFSSFGFIDWLAFNERARTDDDGSSTPISYADFQQRQFDGLQEAGIALGGGDENPFSVANQFQNGVTISQKLFDAAVIVGISGAQRFKQISELGADRQEQILIDQVRQTFYQVLLAQEQATVASQSVARIRTTRNETARRVAQGVEPKFQRLSAEVQLTNLETQLVQIQNQAQSALDNFKFTLGVPVEQPLQLRGTLKADDFNPYLTVSVQNAFATALTRRPDLEQAQVAIELREIQRKAERSNYFPTLEAFGNLSYSGSVPDSRTVIFSDPNDPFSFSSTENDFFSSSYWQPSINVGFRFTWNLFNGFQTSARMQQQKIAIERAKLQETQLIQSVRLEVETSLRNLETARQRIMSQEQNVANAELNYQYVSTRLREGVASHLQERDASEQLDQSRINYLQAVYDYLIARSAFETAVGIPLNQQTDLNLTSIQ